MPVIHKSKNEPHTSACFEKVDGMPTKKRTCISPPPEDNGIEPED